MKQPSRRKKKGTTFEAGFPIRELPTGRRRFLVDIRQGGITRRKTFLTLESARIYCRDTRTELDERGRGAFDLTDAQRLEARDALKLLTGRCSILEAARFWTKYHPAQDAVTFNALLTAYRAHQEARRLRPSTLHELYRLDRVARTFSKQAVTSIQSADLARWLDGRGLGPRNRNAYRRCLVALFNYAVSQDTITTNPAAKVPVVKVDAPPVVFWTATQIADLLHTAEVLIPAMVPTLAIMALAGLRPAEAERLTWDKINLEARIIRLEGGQAKTRARRVVPIADNLTAWLMKYRCKSGAVAPGRTVVTIWKKRLGAALVLGDVPERIARRQKMKGTEIKKRGLDWRTILAEAKAKNPRPWPPDVLRHSYATHHLALHKDEGGLALAMGNSPNVIHTHYKGLVTEAEAQRYFDILPTGQGKVTRFKQAANA